MTYLNWYIKYCHHEEIVMLKETGEFIDKNIN